MRCRSSSSSHGRRCSMQKEASSPRSSGSPNPRRIATKQLLLPASWPAAQLPRSTALWAASSHAPATERPQAPTGVLAACPGRAPRMLLAASSWSYCFSTAGCVHGLQTCLPFQLGADLRCRRRARRRGKAVEAPLVAPLLATQAAYCLPAVKRVSLAWSAEPAAGLYRPATISTCSMR